MRVVTLYCMCIAALFMSGCTLEQMYTAASQKLGLSNSGAAATTPAGSKSEPILFPREEWEIKKNSYYARMEQMRRPDMPSRAYGPSIFGFRLGQTYIQAEKNAKRLGKEYKMCATHARPGYWKAVVKDIKYALYIEFMLDEAYVENYNNKKDAEKQGIARDGHFTVEFNDEGYVKEIFLDKWGLAIFHPYTGYFLPEFSRVTGIPIQEYKENVYNGYGALVSRNTYYFAKGNGWELNITYLGGLFGTHEDTEYLSLVPN